MKQTKKKTNGERGVKDIVVFSCFIFSILLFVGFAFADPTGVGPTNINITSNETFAGQTTGDAINISGGYIGTINISANVINQKWKAFVGWVNGELALRDASGDTIYDWSLAVSSGEVFATRTSGTVTWANINCSNTTLLEAENAALGHTSVSDNITATFSDTTHNAFTVANTVLLGNTCPTLNTYIANVTQDTDFEEMVLHDGTNNVYATILEDSLAGFDGTGYDFQMIMPENATLGAANVIYYIFVEIS